jgi:hypothetical protein
MYSWCIISASAADPGSVGFTFLKVSWGARNAGMGDVGVAVGGSGLYSTYYNPAMTADMKAASVGFMHHEYIFDTRRDFVGASLPFMGGGLTAGLDFFKVSDLEFRQGPTVQPESYFDAHSVVWFAGYARELKKGIRFGVVGKYAYEKIEIADAEAFNFDLGASVDVGADLTLGAALRNLGEKPRFLNEDVDLPLIFAAGAAWQSGVTSIALDVVSAKGEEVGMNIGAERRLAEFLALRAGYKTRYDEEDFAFGLGFTKGIWQVDYAFVPYKSGLGTSHRFALTVNWR